MSALASFTKPVPSVEAIMRVLRTSKGFPTREPMAPAAQPAANFLRKCASADLAPKTPLIGS